MGVCLSCGGYVEYVGICCQCLVDTVHGFCSDAVDWYGPDIVDEFILLLMPLRYVSGLVKGLVGSYAWQCDCKLRQCRFACI